jgi:cell division topological specificity factor
MNKMAFFNRKKKTTSKDVAKDRLTMVLVHDRVNSSPQYLELLKNDMLEAVSKYVAIYEDEIDIKITKVEKGNQMSTKLVANIPIRSMKGRAR